MERTVFNAAQLQILDLMSYVESEDTLNEIKDMLSNYFAQKAEKAIDSLWDSGQINDTDRVGYELPLDISFKKRSLLCGLERFLCGKVCIMLYE